MDQGTIDALKGLNATDLGLVATIHEAWRPVAAVMGDKDNLPGAYEFLRDILLDNPDGEDKVQTLTLASNMSAALINLWRIRQAMPKATQRFLRFAAGKDYEGAIQKALDHLGYLQEDMPAREVELCAHVDKAIEALNAVLEGRE